MDKPTQNIIDNLGKLTIHRSNPTLHTESTPQNLQLRLQPQLQPQLQQRASSLSRMGPFVGVAPPQPHMGNPSIQLSPTKPKQQQASGLSGTSPFVRMTQPLQHMSSPPTQLKPPQASSPSIQLSSIQLKPPQASSPPIQLSSIQLKPQPQPPQHASSPPIQLSSIQLKPQPSYIPLTYNPPCNSCSDINTPPNLLNQQINYEIINLEPLEKEDIYPILKLQNLGIEPIIHLPNESIVEKKTPTVKVGVIHNQDDILQTATYEEQALLSGPDFDILKVSHTRSKVKYNTSQLTGIKNKYNIPCAGTKKSLLASAITEWYDERFEKEKDEK